MLALPYEYAIVQLVPDLQRGERINVGVIVFSVRAELLICRHHLDADRLAALAPGLDMNTVQHHLDAMRWVCEGDARGGPIAELSQRERFHWLVHPRSAMLQTSDVHAGLCDDLLATLDALFKRLVRTPS